MALIDVILLSGVISIPIIFLLILLTAVIGDATKDIIKTNKDKNKELLKLKIELEKVRKEQKK